VFDEIRPLRLRLLRQGIGWCEDRSAVKAHPRKLSDCTCHGRVSKLWMEELCLISQKHQ
jgi:hypothetical protein